jgi:hypothetical protein
MRMPQSDLGWVRRSRFRRYVLKRTNACARSGPLGKLHWIARPLDQTHGISRFSKCASRRAPTISFFNVFDAGKPLRSNRMSLHLSSSAARAMQASDAAEDPASERVLRRVRSVTRPLYPPLASPYAIFGLARPFGVSHILGTMREILPGIFTWGSTYAFRPWDLNGYAIRLEGCTVLVDPPAPAEDD